MKDEKFCPHCLQWYDWRSQYSVKHVSGDCAPLTLGSLREELAKLVEKIK